MAPAATCNPGQNTGGWDAEITTLMANVGLLNAVAIMVFISIPSAKTLKFMSVLSVTPVSSHRRDVRSIEAGITLIM